MTKFTVVIQYLMIDCSILYRVQSSRWLFYRSLEDENRPRSYHSLYSSKYQTVDQNQKKANRRPSYCFRFQLYLCYKCGQLINWPINSILSRHNKIYQIFKEVYRHIFLRQFNSIHVNNPIRPTFTLCLYLCSSLLDFRLSAWL